jgi:hypothetical protein
VLPQASAISESHKSRYWTNPNPDAPNVLQAMMKLERANARAKTANKVALEVEKEKDAVEKEVEELKRQMHPKRAHGDTDAGDAHEIHAEVDNWDLICQKTIQLLVPRMLPCARARTWIPVKWPRSLGVRLYAF